MPMSDPTVPSADACTRPPHVLVERRAEHVAVVTLNRPEAMNAISPEMTMLMERTVDELEADDDVRAVVLTGSGGRVFCAGADLKQVAAGNIAELVSDRFGLAGFVNAQRSKPWIAAVEGMALAGGCQIALACDLIVASEGGAFGLPEVTRGIVPYAGALYRLPRILPPAIATEMILTANRLPSERAHAYGLVNRLVPAGTVVEAAVALAREITANAPLAVCESLRIVRMAAQYDDAELQRLSNEAQARIMETEDFREGPRAFVEKRPPRWLGR